MIYRAISKIMFAKLGFKSTRSSFCGMSDVTIGGKRKYSPYKASYINRFKKSKSANYIMSFYEL